MAPRKAPAHGFGPRPSYAELLEHIEGEEIAAQELATRWNDDVTAEIRAEVMTKFRDPALRLLIRANRRPFPRPMT